MLSQEQRVLRARIAANARWARVADRKAVLAKAHRGFLRRFEREVDPDSKLPEDVRLKLAVNARNAHMSRLAYKKAAKARQAKQAKEAAKPKKRRIVKLRKRIKRRQS